MTESTAAAAPVVLVQ